MEDIMTECSVAKRNGSKEKFDQSKLVTAVEHAFDYEVNDEDIDKIVDMVLDEILDSGKSVISTEEINDFVERSLMSLGFYEEARNFILYREEVKNIKKMSIDNDTMSEYIFTNRYSRYLPRKQRRETWNEAVDRVRDMHIEKYPQIEESIIWAFEQVRQKRVLPSLRSMQFGGDPIIKNNARMFNCSYGIADSLEFFSEAIFLLLCGCGVGFSVEFDYVNKLPIIKKPSSIDIRHITIEDSIEGWADSVKELIKSYFEGYTVEFIYKKIRKEGSLIKSGGKAPGHIPLRRALEKIRNILDGAIGRKLKPIEVYDIIMHESDAVLSGGVRRCISKGSKVLVKDSSFKNIEDVEIGDMVSTNNGWKPVINKFEQGIQKTVIIKHQDGELKCTPNHRVAVLTSYDGKYEWKYAGDLKRGDRLFFVDNCNESKIIPIEFYEILEGDEVETYDIEVEDNHNFICEGIMVHNSATICLFSPDDDEMSNAKTGNWFEENPQRGRSNNSVKLDRNNISKEQFLRIFNKQKEFGEPGFLFVSNPDMGVNPCQPDFATILTPDGIRQFKDIDIGSTIWSEEGWTKVINKWSTGIKKVFEYETTGGNFIGTENHRIKSNGIKIEVKDSESIDLLQGDIKEVNINPVDVMDGIVLGDGSVHKTSKNPVYLCIGENDHDYFNSEIKELIYESNTISSPYSYDIKTTIISDELSNTYFRKIPDRFKFGNHEKVYSFLRGLYSANGSICGKRVTLKSASKDLIDDVQLMLSSVGIRSYYTTNKPSNIKWDNGEYVSKESYDLNISTDRKIFKEYIGFIQKYKNEKLDNICNGDIRNGIKNHNIININYLGEFEVYDITVDNKSHTYWTGGLNVSNCCEISLNPFLEKGYIKSDGSFCEERESGFSFCNLSTMNGSMIKTEKDFEIATKAATIIGTCQAGFTNFTYLRNTSSEICKREALLGVSITGMMDSPEILLNPDLQRKMAEVAIKINKRISKRININSSARITCIKPEGTSSILLNTASGIHPRYAKRYFRRVQANVNDPVYQHFKEQNPHCCEPSVWSANGTDDVITFCVIAPEGAITKDDISALEFLKIVKSTQENWVRTGTAIPESSKDFHHNVSNTCIFQENESDEVADFIYENREFFTGISLLSDLGDNIYQQAPHQQIRTRDDESIWMNYIESYQKVDYTNLNEVEDATEHKTTVACAGGACDLSLHI